MGADDKALCQMDKAFWGTLAAQTNVNARDDSGWTVLTWAVMDGSVDMIEQLVSNGADVSGENEKGRRPVDYAVWNCRKEVVRMLVARGGPWKTLVKAASAARAGDTVLVYEGDYRQDESSWGTGKIAIANSGISPDDLITFTAAPEQKPILKTILIHDRQWIVIRGFKFENPDYAFPGSWKDIVSHDHVGSSKPLQCSEQKPQISLCPPGVEAPTFPDYGIIPGGKTRVGDCT